jgi:hypothetical protein
LKTPTLNTKLTDRKISKIKSGKHFTLALGETLQAETVKERLSRNFKQAREVTMSKTLNFEYDNPPKEFTTLPLFKREAKSLERESSQKSFKNRPISRN